RWPVRQADGVGQRGVLGCDLNLYPIELGVLIIVRPCRPVGMVRLVGEDGSEMTCPDSPAACEPQSLRADEPFRGDERPVIILSPPRGWQLINVGELWQFRELIYFLTWRDVKVRYKQTLLGAAWAILQPLLMMVIFTVFFGRMAGVPSGGFD